MKKYEALMEKHGILKPWLKSYSEMLLRSCVARWSTANEKEKENMARIAVGNAKQAEFLLDLDIKLNVDAFGNFLSQELALLMCYNKFRAWVKKEDPDLLGLFPKIDARK